MICIVCKGVGAIPGFWLGSLKTCPACHGVGKSGLSDEIDLAVLRKRIEMLEAQQKDLLSMIEQLVARCA